MRPLSPYTSIIIGTVILVPKMAHEYTSIAIYSNIADRIFKAITSLHYIQ